MNPFNIATSRIENNLPELLASDWSFTHIFKGTKEGKDFYPALAPIQIFLTVYLLFFYTLITSIRGYNLSESTKYFQFSANMVEAVLAHVGSILVERWITLLTINRTTKLVIKYFYTMAIFLAFSFFILYQAPYLPAISTEGSRYIVTAALIVFSVVYFLYFWLSALQIKYGYKQFKSINSFMTRRGYSDYYLMTIYTAIPFLY